MSWDTTYGQVVRSPKVQKETKNDVYYSNTNIIIQINVCVFFQGYIKSQISKHLAELNKSREEYERTTKVLIERVQERHSDYSKHKIIKYVKTTLNEFNIKYNTSIDNLIKQDKFKQTKTKCGDNMDTNTSSSSSDALKVNTNGTNNNNKSSLLSSSSSSSLASESYHTAPITTTTTTTTLTKTDSSGYGSSSASSASPPLAATTTSTNKHSSSDSGGRSSKKVKSSHANNNSTNHQTSTSPLLPVKSESKVN